MSASDLKPGNADPISLPLSQAEGSLESAVRTSTNHHKDEIESETIELLREFFLLLDQWDQEQQA
jgi:hypothetical protein